MIPVRIVQALSLGLALWSLPADFALAQVPSAANALDPESPMAELPDLGVAWPEPINGAANSVAVMPVTGETTAERRYTVRLQGIGQVDDDSFVTRFDALSSLRQNDSKPANIAQIDRRVREDKRLLEDLLRSSGYYAGHVEVGIESDATNGGLVVFMTLTPGPLYRFAEVRVEGIDESTEKGRALRSAFSVSARDPVDAEDVLAAETALRTSIVESGYPFATVTPAEVVIDHDTKSATLLVRVDTGKEQKIGGFVVRGEKAPFDGRHVARLARTRPGEVYNQAKIEDLKRALMATGLVSSVRLEPVKTDVEGVVDLAVTLEPAPMRTIAAEVGFGTGEGFQAEVSWTHRNLIKPEGAFTARTVLGTQEQIVGVSLRMSNFGKRDRIFTTQATAANTQRAAYDARTLGISASLERQTNLIWQKKWTWSIGGEFLFTQERDVTVSQFGRRDYLIGAFPMLLGYDGSDNLLDPTRGFRLTFRFSPEFSYQNGSSGYVRTQLDGSFYTPVSERVVMAGRVRLGTLLGSDAFSVAPSRRFYAGGGSSVRGFGYQNIGPRDSFNDPVGGRSLTEFALEARVRFGDFSIVPFVDGGNIYLSPLPKFSSFRFGAGLGVRYHSSFGPIRIDVGTPLNRQPGDSLIGVYVSLGQAF